MTLDTSTDTEGQLGRYQFEITGCTFGTYNVLIVDALNNSVQSSVEIGGNLVSFTSEIRDFNCVVGGPNMNDDLAFRGGYIEISNVRMPSLPDNVTGFTLVIRDSDKRVVGEESIGRNETGTTLIKVNEANATNYLYVRYDCGQGDGNQEE